MIYQTLHVKHQYMLKAYVKRKITEFYCVWPIWLEKEDKCVIGGVLLAMVPCNTLVSHPPRFPPHGKFPTTGSNPS